MATLRGNSRWLSRAGRLVVLLLLAVGYEDGTLRVFEVDGQGGG